MAIPPDSSTSRRPASGSRFLPQLDREGRKELIDRIRLGAVGDADYFVMMAIAAVLASLGLLQGSGAVIIGAMLVAPLMAPLLAAGLALVQGNPALMRRGITMALSGIGLAFAISLVIGMLNPGYEPSMEIEARGKPDLLDLGIAFASGMAGAYASGRPKVASTLAGVAIAAALVPPLTVIGIAATNGRPVVAANASVLLLTNLVCIVLGAAFIFQLLGVRARAADAPLWVRRSLMGLGLTVLVLVAPLTLNVQAVQRIGQARPLSYPVGADVREAVELYLRDWPQVELIAIARNGVEPAAGITALLATDDGLPRGFEEQLRDVIQEAHRGEPLVRVFALDNAIAEDFGGALSEEQREDIQDELEQEQFR